MINPFSDMQTTESIHIHVFPFKVSYSPTTIIGKVVEHPASIRKLSMHVSRNVRWSDTVVAHVETR